MGAYLSEPVTEKLSSDEEGIWLSYGGCSMQGWRVSQEDAHNSILNFDDDTHIFAVYDGHGGHEVSAYTSLKLPEYLKNTQAYKDGRLPTALIDTFLGLDATLVKQEVVAELKIIAGAKDGDEEGGDDSDSEGEDVQDLYREATMPLDQVMARYPHLAHHGKDKVASPFLKGKSGGSNSDPESPSKFDFAEKDSKDEATTKASSGLSSDKSDSKEMNGEGPKHMVNGEEEEEEDVKVEEDMEEEKKENVEAKEEEEEEEEDMEEDDDEEKKEGATSTKKEELKENGDSVINGEQDTVTGKGKGKCSGKGGKGKSLLKNSEIQAMKEAKAKGRRREAAIRAAEIYRKIQEGGGEGAKEEEATDDDEDEEDDNFEEEEEEGGDDEEGEEDADGEESEEEEDDDDDDEAEVEEEDDPYAEFAMNMKEEPGYDSGCTACVAVVKGARVFVANVGDSRCVVSRDGTALDLSLDHKPEDDPEAARIIKAGGRVTADGRVNGGLNLSRAIGDHGYKQNKSLQPEEQMISPLPDVRSLALTPEDNFMIVACDGIWNSLTSQEACDFVSTRIEQDMMLSKICEELFDHCLAPDTHGDGTGCDNMTCIIIQFDPKELEGRGGDKDEGVVEEHIHRAKTTNEEEEEDGNEEEEEEDGNEEEEEDGNEEEEEKEEVEEKKDDSRSKVKAAVGLKRGADEAELNSPKAEEKKLKATSE